MDDVLNTTSAGHEFFELIKNEFSLETVDPREMSPLILAHIGDGVYELIVRSVVDTVRNRQINKIHKEDVKYVKAEAQSRMIQALEPDLTEEELSVYRRGKNAHTNTFPKNGTKADYHRATGFEALVGYLYLTGRMERCVMLVKKGFEAVG